MRAKSSLFYEAPAGRALAAAAAWGACTAADWRAAEPPATEGTSATPGQLLYLAVATEDAAASESGGDGGGNGTALEVRALPEFAYGQSACLMEKRPVASFTGNDLGDASFRAANPAWQCKEDPYAAGCCYDSGVDRCASLGQFDGGGGVCVDRVAMTSADDGALAVPKSVRVLSLAAARQGVNEGAFAELPISSAAAAVDAADAAASSSSSSVVGGIVDEVAVDLDASNITGDASNATRRVSRLNTVKCDSRVEGSTGACDISNDLYTVLFVGLANSTVRAIGLQEFLCRSAGAASAVDGALRTSQLTQLYTQGVPSRLLPSPNAQHLFVVQTRPAYQLDSRAALHAACSNFTADPTDPFVAPYAPLCDNASAIDSRPLNLFDFVSYHSVCRPGTECPSLLHPNTSSVVRGSFTLRPIQSPRVCPAGFFCVAGVRLPCLAGFVCPETNMSFPTRCAADAAAASTCYRQQLSEVQRCPDGMVCPVPQVQPFAAPPGRYVAPTPRLPLHECQGGQWCPLMAANESECTDADDDAACAADDADDDAVVLKPNGLLCPANTYCPDPAMMRPELCFDGNISDVLYCPEGTQDALPCPVGRYCSMPNESEPCGLTNYCPAGSGIEKPCPAGTYCPTPSESILCPEGSFCRIGSTQSKRCFFFLSYCPPGQAAENNLLTGILASALLIIVVAAILYLCLNWREKRMRRIKRRLEQHTEKKRARKLLDETIDLVRNSSRIRSNSQPLAVADAAAAGGSSGSGVGATPPPLALTPSGGGGGKAEAAQRKLAKKFARRWKRAADVGENAHDRFQSNKKKRLSEIGFLDLTMQLHNTDPKRVKPILDRLTGIIPAAKLTAIMGPSGSGKTSFITSLAGRAHYAKVTGGIYLNGSKVDLKSKAFRDQVGFVPQDDIMHTNLTVFEQLLYTARLRLPITMRRETQLKGVHHVISQARPPSLPPSPHYTHLIFTRPSRDLPAAARRR